MVQQLSAIFLVMSPMLVACQCDSDTDATCLLQVAMEQPHNGLEDLKTPIKIENLPTKAEDSADVRFSALLLENQDDPWKVVLTDLGRSTAAEKAAVCRMTHTDLKTAITSNTDMFHNSRVANDIMRKLTWVKLQCDFARMEYPDNEDLSKAIENVTARWAGIANEAKARRLKSNLKTVKTEADKLMTDFNELSMRHAMSCYDWFPEDSKASNACSQSVDVNSLKELYQTMLSAYNKALDIDYYHREKTDIEPAQNSLRILQTEYDHVKDTAYKMAEKAMADGKGRRGGRRWR